MSADAFMVQRLAMGESNEGESNAEDFLLLCHVIYKGSSTMLRKRKKLSKRKRNDSLKLLSLPRMLKKRKRKLVMILSNI